MLKMFNVFDLCIIFTRRYGPLRYATQACFQLLRRVSAEAFITLRSKKDFVMLLRPIFGNFWFPVVTLVTFSSNLSHFVRNL